MTAGSTLPRAGLSEDMFDNLIDRYVFGNITSVTSFFTKWALRTIDDDQASLSKITSYPLVEYSQEESY